MAASSPELNDNEVVPSFYLLRVLVMAGLSLECDIGALQVF